MDPNPYLPPQAPIELLETSDDSPGNDEVSSRRKWYSLTLMEVLVILAVTGLLLALFLPATPSAPRRHHRRSSDVAPGDAPDRESDAPLSDLPSPMPNE